MRKTNDLHVVETRSLMPPITLKSELPITQSAADLVADTRDRIRAILDGEDSRLLVVVGPCSIHDVQAAYEYGQHLLQLRTELADSLEIVMRVYFEKPRTSVGWKGLINDPLLDESFDINLGLRLARKLLLDLSELGLPSATELLDPIIPQYIADVISWTAIGARTTESQTHREMASGLSMPVGFKNGTDGNFDSAINAMHAARRSHHFLGINTQGFASIVTTTGNPCTHLVLRGGKRGPNYDAAHVAAATSELSRHGCNPRLMVDCSHGNAMKDPLRQIVVCQDIAEQLQNGSQSLMGVMIESHLVGGNQPLGKDLNQLVYGQSITDPCVDFSTTAILLRQLAQSINKRQRVPLAAVG
jgi:3-deoxy-7-phosphoheptulonate synthase